MEKCIFCHHIAKEAILYQTEHFKLVFDIDPIQTGHLLLISKEHYKSLSQLPRPLLHECIEAQAYLIALLEKELPIDGVTVVTNDKDLMDEGTHLHLHLIPRVKNDGFWEQVSLEYLDLPFKPVLQYLNNETI